MKKTYTCKGMGAPWRDRQIEHAKSRFGKELVQKLDKLLKQPDLPGDARSGGLRLAGHLSESVLGDAIAACWASDSDRTKRLADYLWAAAQCCGNDSKRLLGPVCDEWAALPDDESNGHSELSRSSLAAYHIAWAFKSSLPLPALHYFIKQAQDPKLRWPITYMLRGVDQPDAVEFLANELAAFSSQLEGTDSFSPALMFLKYDWQRQNGEGMSLISRLRLQELWICTSNDKHLRRQAFELWATTVDSNDIKLLQTVENSDVLADNILRARIEHGDRTAIPLFIDKLTADDCEWWQYGRDIWSEKLTEALDEALQRRSHKVNNTWGKSYTIDALTSELIMRLNDSTAENLLSKHWEHLRFSPYFVQAALYIATPFSCRLAEETISICPDRIKMLAHIQLHYGIKQKGHPGVRNIRQLEVLVPYLDFIDPMDLYSFWDCCNEKGWFDFRRTYLDSRLKGKWRDMAVLDEQKIFADLDEILAAGQAYKVEFMIDKLIKQEESLDRIFNLLKMWLSKHQTIDALDLVAEATIHAGTRLDIELLCIDGIEPTDQAKAILADARFEVYRRSLV